MMMMTGRIFVLPTFISWILPLLIFCVCFHWKISRSNAWSPTIANNNKYPFFTNKKNKSLLLSSSSLFFQSKIQATTTTTTTNIPLLHSTPFEASFYDVPSGDDDNNKSNKDGDDDDDDDPTRNNPYEQQQPTSSSSLLSSCPLKVDDKDTRLVLGLNKYSHDTSLCAANADTGEVLFAISKERISRKKHDAGNVATIVETCLESLDLQLENIEKVVMNNHHHRILPLVESNIKNMEWECGLQINGGNEDGYDDEENLLSIANNNKVEISHHLAHAYSAAAQCPFDDGLIVIMDGMGETYRTMMRAKEQRDESYISDFTLLLNHQQQQNENDDDNDDDHHHNNIHIIPSDIDERIRTSYFDWREAESVYTFTKSITTTASTTTTENDDDKSKNKELTIRPIFKRFTPENTPPTLYNHGFENMDSVGALYSRASSDIFGDWNACGKVMGLAPWMVHSWQTATDEEEKEEAGDSDSTTTTTIVAPRREDNPIMTGKLYSDYCDDNDDAFKADRSLMSGQPLIAKMDPELFDHEGNYLKKRRYDFDDNDGVPVPPADGNNINSINNNNNKLLPTQIAMDAITLAHRIQTDLEDTVIDFVKHFKEETNENNLCLAGGVALNSVLNGRLARELGFEKTFIPPYPGDDGIAVGCCAFGLYGPPKAAAKPPPKNNNKPSPTLWTKPLTPYLGPQYTESDIKMAIEDASPWLEVEAVRNEDRRLELMAQEVESGGIVAWFQGRSELGPRALGHRSILADPRKKGLVRFINQHVKKRETFRPFAPSALAEEAHKWFDLGPAVDAAREDTNDASYANNISPYMSMTAFVHEDKRASIPAVTHVDGSSRLQTVTKEAEPLYHKFISQFFKRTGIPMVLNTSFNTLPGEPIVETPKNAIRSFLCSMGSIEMLVLGDYIIKRKKPNLRRLLGETTKEQDVVLTEPACPMRTGPAYFQSSFELRGDETDEDDVEPITKVRMPRRPMHDERTEGWFDLKDELEGEVLAVCDGTVVLNEMLAQYTAAPASEEPTEEDMTDSQVLAQGVIERLCRLYEHTLISW